MSASTRLRRGCVPIGYSWTLRRPSFSGPQPAAVFISCRSYRSGSVPTTFHQLPPLETLEFTSTAMSRWCLAVSTCYSVLRQLRTIRHGSVSRSVLQSLVSPLVLSRLDYGNSTLAGVSSHLLSRLQSVMNAATRLIFSSSRFQHITPLLRQLHWLKAPERIAFKQSVLVYKCLHGSAPAYLTDELCQVADVETRQRLRFSSSSSLIVSHTRLLTIGDWNSLPDPVTSASSVAVFRSRLKTHLFNISYPCVCTVPAQWHYNRFCLLTRWPYNVTLVATNSRCPVCRDVIS